MERRKRRSFTPEFRADAVRLVREGSKSLPQVAKDLDLTESALRNWVREADGGEGKESADALSTAECVHRTMWNTDSGASGTLIPEQVERPFRPCGTPIPGKWNAPVR